jgi:hypothetical protein
MLSRGQSCSCSTIGGGRREAANPAGTCTASPANARRRARCAGSSFSRGSGRHWVGAKDSEGGMTDPTRSCARCGRSLDGRRPQAIYCGGPCRAAASRERALSRPAPRRWVFDLVRHKKRTRTAHATRARAWRWGE